jgi:hypothetical protein
MTDYNGGQIKKLSNSNPDIEVELRLDINPRLSLGLGIGYFSSESKSDFEFIGPFPFQSELIYSQSYSIDAEIQSIPLKLSIYYSFPLTSAARIYLNGGVDVFFSKESLHKYHYSSGGVYDSLYKKLEAYSINSKGLGLHASIGTEISVTKSFALILEAQVRVARIDHLRATRSYQTYGGEGEDKGILYLGQRELAGYGDSCPDLIVSASMPTGNEFKKVKEGALDFSGFSLKGGILVRLF